MMVESQSSQATQGASPAAGAGLLFLREEELRLAQDLLLLATRELAQDVDALLAQHGLGRAHHRALHFIARQPGLTVGDLLALLGITKQSLARVLATLHAEGLIEQMAGRRDRRQRLLRLTEAGLALERALFERQRERLLAAYREAGGGAVEGFRRVLRLLLTPAARAALDRARVAALAARSGA